MKLLLGTTNQGKMREYKWIFDDYSNVELVTPEKLGIAKKPAETGDTFQENALIKARFYCDISGLASLGDDGGIEIDALGGEPGVKSRRWLGHECSDEELIDHCLKRMRNIPQEKRNARFNVIVVIAFPDGKIVKGEGMQKGYISQSRVKELMPGYPFRSIFIREDGNVSPDNLWEGHYSHRKAAIKQILGTHELEFFLLP